MSFERPPAEARPPTSGVPTGMRPPSRTRGGTEVITPGSNININTRPLTNQGLPSGHTASGQRQVADKNYFIGIIRQRITDIVEEIKRISTEIETRKRGQSIQVTLNQQVKELREEIIKGEAELADYNVLQDRIKDGVSLDDMQQSFNDLQYHNAQREQEVNRVFREKRDLEELVDQQKKQAEAILKGEGAPELLKMTKEIEQLEQMKHDLQAQTGDLHGKTKEQLLQMVKETTSQIGDIEKKIQDENKTIHYIEGQMKLVDERNAELQTDVGQRYLKLRERERLINEFIQKSPQLVQDAQANIVQIQKDIVRILNNTARAIESMNELPTQDNYRQMQTDLDYKKRQRVESEQTAQALRSEVEARRADLARLQFVDKDLEKEVASLKQKMVDMEQEMPQFADVDTVRADGEIRKKIKVTERDGLQQHLSQLKRAVNQIVTQFNEMKAANRSNEMMVKLHALEKKEVRSRMLDKYTNLETIEDMRRQTNYTSIKRACITLIGDMNTLL